MSDTSPIGPSEPDDVDLHILPSHLHRAARAAALPAPLLPDDVPAAGAGDDGSPLAEAV